MDESGNITIDRSEYIHKKGYQELLEIWFQGLETIPNEIFNTFPNLNFVSVRGTNMTKLEASCFQNATKLSKAWISENNLIRLNSSTFIGAPNLEYLSLTSNRIKMLHKKTFKGLPKLKALYLRINELEILDKNIFTSLKSLEVLDLSSNKLSTLNFNLMYNEKINKISFLHNKIYSINPTIFDNKENLDLVDVMDNECVDTEFNGLKGDVMKLKAGLFGCFVNHTEVTGDIYYRIDKGFSDMNARINSHIITLYVLAILLIAVLIGVFSAIAYQLRKLQMLKHLTKPQFAKYMRDSHVYDYYDNNYIDPNTQESLKRIEEETECEKLDKEENLEELAEKRDNVIKSQDNN
jgi:hypothetical protein